MESRNYTYFTIGFRYIKIMIKFSLLAGTITLIFLAPFAMLVQIVISRAWYSSGVLIYQINGGMINFR